MNLLRVGAAAAVAVGALLLAGCATAASGSGTRAVSATDTSASTEPTTTPEPSTTAAPASSATSTLALTQPEWEACNKIDANGTALLAPELWDMFGGPSALAQDYVDDIQYLIDQGNIGSDMVLVLAKTNFDLSMQQVDVLVLSEKPWDVEVSRTAIAPSAAFCVDAGYEFTGAPLQVYNQ